MRTGGLQRTARRSLPLQSASAQPRITSPLAAPRRTCKEIFGQVLELRSAHLTVLTLNRDHDGDVPSCSRIRRQTPSPLPLVGMFLGNSYVFRLDAVNLKELNKCCLVWMLSWVKSLITFATISVPRSIYCVLSYSMTLTVSISSIAYRQVLM